MKPYFFKLEAEKRNRIIAVATEEFAAHPFEVASLNRIIETCGISKGGLFKYIEGKEDLYLYCLETHLSALLAHQAQTNTLESPDLFDRLEAIFLSSMDFYREHLAAYHMIVRAFTIKQGTIGERAMALRQTLVADQQEQLLKAVDWTLYRLDQGALLSLFQVVSDGITIGAEQHAPPEMLIQKMSLVLDALRRGVYQAVTS